MGGERAKAQVNEETADIVRAVERLQGAFEELAVRGLRSAGPQQLASLQALREELDKVGAGHLAGRVAAVIDAVRSDDRGAAAALLRAQASLRVFERVLTLEVAGEALGRALTSRDNEDTP
jgi:hypothetical protein